MTPYKLELVVTTALLFVMSALVIWIRTANVRSTYDFVKKETEIQTLKKESQDLRIQLAQLTSPQKLKKLSSELNLQAPKFNQIYRHTPKAGAPHP